MILDGLSFDDVLLVPEYSEVESRSQVDVSVTLGKRKFSHPIIPANMKTVIGAEMAWEIVRSGGLAILHRFMSIEEQLNIAEDIIDNGKSDFLAMSVGVKDEDKRNLSSLIHLGVRKICIDIAHGDSKHCISMIEHIKREYPEVYVIAGNVATGRGAQRLWEAGADMVKANVGGGSVCTTRIETGNGVPVLSSIMDIAKTQRLLRCNEELLHPHNKSKRRTFPFIADGGIRSAGDVVKALCFADMVMVGNLFAGCDEAPGEHREINGVSYKEYAGSSTHKANHVEGVAAMVPYRGPYKQVLTKLLEGLRSGCSYQGVSNLSDLKDNPTFIRISQSGLIESHPHNVVLK